MSPGLGAGWAAALIEWIQRFDNDPRTIGSGAAAGAAVAVLMAAGADAQFHMLAWMVLVLALIAPSAGLTAIAVLALMREPDGLGPLGFNATVIGACGLGAAARVLIAGLAGRRVSIRPEFVAIGAFIALSTYQFLRLVGRVSDEREQFGRTQLTDVAAGLLLILLVSLVFTPRSRHLLVVAMIPGIMVAAIAAIASLSPELIQSLPIRGLLPPTDVSARGTGIFYNPNYLGQAMAMSALLLGRSGRLGLPAWLGRRAVLLTIPVVVAVIASFSRGAVLALVSGAVSSYAARGRRKLVSAVGIGLLVAVVGYQGVLVMRHALAWGNQVELSGAAQAVSDSSRLAVHVAGIRLFLRDPALGIGIGQFHYESPRYLSGSPVTYAHDVYLQIGAEQGLLGLGTYLAVLLALFLALRRADEGYRLAATSMLFAFAVGSLFAEPITDAQTSFVLWIAVGAALVNRADPEHVTSATDHVRRSSFRPRAPAPQTGLEA